ncbi:MAG: HAMP domain-containing protein, partial [bacterium]
PLFDAYVSGLRSLVEDSTLSFFNYLAFFSSAPLIFTTINLLLLSLAFLLLTLIVIYLVERILKYPMKEDLARWGFIVLVYLFTGTIWLLVTKHTFYLAERTVLIFLLGSLAVWMDRRVLRAKMSSLMPIVLLTSVSTLISFPIFYEEILSEERNLIRSRTLEALRPAEGSIRSVMEGSLDHFGRSQNIRESLLSKDHPNLENLAFVEWAKSPLSRLSFGSSVTILDGSGLNVSRFGIDIPLGLEQAPAAVLEEIEEAGGKFLTVSKSRIGGEEIELYSGAVPIVADEKVRGAVILTIAVVKAPWGALARLEGVYPTLLRPFSAEQEVRHKYGPAKIVLSTYEKETLVESTDPAIVRGYRPSDLVLGLIFDEKVDYVGAEETIGGKRYMNLYFPQKVDEKVVGMISVGYEKPHRWTALFDLLRLLFTNLLSALGIYLTYRLGSAAIHRDWRRLFSMKRFQHRLLVSFAVLIILPMIFMAYFGRRMIISQQEDWIRSHIEEDLTIARTLMEEESITAAQEIASNPEIIRFVTDPAEKIPAVLNRKGATVSILDPEGGEIWSTGGERADFKIEKEVRSTLLPRVFYSHKPPLALGAIAPIVGEEGESDLRGLVEYGRPIDDGLCRKLSHRIKRDVNVYHKGVEVASTRPELFQSEFLSTKLPGDAFLNVELLGKSSFHAKRAMGAYPYIEGYQPLTDGLGRTAGVLSIPMIYQQHRLDQETARTISLVLVVYGLILSLTLLIGLILSRRISSPIRELTDGTRKVAAGDLDFRIDIKAKDELGDLVASFNKMTGDLKASQKKLVQAEKEVAWREMARQVAHEIKNPLTPMKLSVQHIAQAYKDKAKDFEKILTESTRMVTEQIEVLRNIASEFSSFARLPRRRVERCNINTVMKTSLRLFADSFKGVKIIARYGEPMPSVEADRKEMQGVFVNLIQNALQAMPGGGTLQIRTEVQTAHVEGGEQSLIAIEIVDTGCGIPEDFKGRL